MSVAENLWLKGIVFVVVFRYVTMILKRLIVFVFFLALSFFCHSDLLAGNEWNADDVFVSGNIGDRIEFFEDAQRSYRIEDIMDLSDDVWNKPESRILNMGYTNAAYWIRFEVNNPADEKRVRYFVSEFTLLETVSVFWENPQQQVESLTLSRNQPYSDRIIDHEHFVFPFTVLPGEERTVYVRVTSAMDMVLALFLYSPEQFLTNSTRRAAMTAVFYGAILVMFFYNLFLFFSLRDFSYLFYSLYVITFLFYQMAYFGQGTKYLWGEWPYFEMRSVIIFMSLFIGVFGAGFFRLFLKLRKNHPMLNRLIQYYSLFSLLLFCSTLIVDPAFMVQFFPPYAILSIIGFLSIAVYVRIKGFRPANFLIAAFGLLFIGGIFAALRSMGIVPYNDLTMYGIQFAGAVEVVLLSFGLADRINQERAEKLIAQDKALEAERKLKHDLSSLVEIRTKDLKESLQARDQFLSIIAHDLRGPMGNISYLLKHMLDNKKHRDYDLLERVQLSSSNTYELLENLLAWARGQSGKITAHPKNFPIQKLVMETVQLLEAMARNKDISIITEVPDSIFVYADESMIQTVLRNLLNNAIKFSHPNSEIRVVVSELPEREDFILMSVKDSGTGIAANKINDIISVQGPAVSSRGTANESGTGLGLALCRDFVHASGGQMSIHSEVGIGSTFEFTVPEGIFAPEAEHELEVLQTLLQQSSVLIVEDNDLNLHTILMEVFSMGPVLSVAKNLEEAMDFASKFHFDFLLSDINLPDGNGIDLARKVQKWNPLTRIYAVTSFASGDLADAKPGLFDGSLHKPFRRQVFQHAALAFLEEIMRSIDYKKNYLNAMSRDKELLVIEDSPEVVDVLAVLLSTYSFNLTVMQTAEEALDLLSRSSFDLILSDIQLSDRDGYDFLEGLKAADPDHAPVLAITAHDSPSEVKRLFACGFSGYIRKPFRKESLALHLVSFLIRDV